MSIIEKVLAGLLIAAFAFGGWQWTSKTRLEAKLANVEHSLALQEALTKAEQERIEKELAAISAQHKQDKEDADKLEASLRSELRSSALKLREHYTCPSEPSKGGLSPDEAARLREEDAAASIADAKRADDWIKRLQEVIREYERIGPR